MGFENSVSIDHIGSNTSDYNISQPAGTDAITNEQQVEYSQHDLDSANGGDSEAPAKSE